MKSLAEFFAMGGYAVYVWSSYALAAVVLVWHGGQPPGRERGLMQSLAGRARGRSAA